MSKANAAAPRIVALLRLVVVGAIGPAGRVAALSSMIALTGVDVAHGQGGGTLVYVVHQDADFWPQPAGLALMRPDGSSQVQLTFGADTEPAWSPDASRIAFSRSSDIYVIPATGGPPST